MVKTEFMNKLTRSLHGAGLQLRKHSPEILAVAGIVGVVASAVMACKATTKVNDVVETHKKRVKTIHAAKEVGIMNDEPYTEEDGNKHLTMTYAHTGLELLKLYGPSLALGTLSIASILTSNNILRKRNLAAVAAYHAVDKSFKGYRSRVVDRFGKDLDRELLYNIKVEEIEETVVDENGNETTVKNTVEILDPNTLGEYTRVFDCGNPGWDKDPDNTMFFLKQQQRFANEKLQSRGHLFLNEVFDLLGYPRTKIGNKVGWVLDHDNPDCDNFVDFGIYDLSNERKRMFINGEERAILLEFNVDGDIYELLP